MQKILKELFDQFVKTNGREPNNLEMILIRQKASTQEINKRKIISMFDRSPVDADKPILGGKNIEETDTQILERLNKGNENSLSNMRYENAVKAEEAKAAADEDYIMKVFDPEDFSDGGRAGYYGGGQAMVGEDLSEIGHGSDSLMARNMQLSPNGQATTSTGLNYLLGEDNDTVRVPYKDGLGVKVPPSKPYTTEMFEDDSMIFLKGMYGTGKQSNPMFYNEMIKKGNKLREQGVERETIIEIIKKNKDKIDMILKQQTGDIKSFAEGGPARQNFKMGRRAFLGLMGSVAGGIAGIKTGLFGVTKGGGKKAATEVAKEVATGGPPPYFLNLVKKIKNLGDDAKRLAVKDKENVTTYKDYTLTEDVVTGEKTIQRMKVTDDGSESFYGQPLTEETYMSYKPGKSLADETTKGKTIPDEYEEGTAFLRSDRGNAGEVVEESATISDDVIEEGTMFEDNLSDFGKADGGRIGYAGGKKVVDQVIKKVNNKFGKKVVTTGDDIEIPKETLLRDMFKDAFTAPVKQEGKFTKAEYLIERIKNTIKGSPDDKYVQDTFPGFIDELKANPDLAKNENVFKELGGGLPENQQIVVYGDDTLDFFTTSSGPKNIKKLENFMAKHDLSKDKALEIMKMEPNDQVMELTKIKFMKRKQTNN